MTGDCAPRPARRSAAVIDYLRGIAALGVALYHMRIFLWVGWRAIASSPARYTAADRMLAYLSLPTTLAGEMVMLFFVISGFCVHLPYARSGAPFQPAAYLKRRFLRIYPPYFAALLATFLVAWWAHGLPGTAHTIRDSAIHVCMAENYLGSAPASGTAQSPATLFGANVSLWSLPVEMELYLVYPLVLMGLRRWGAGRTLAGVACLSAIGTLGSLAGHPVWSGNFMEYWIIWCGGAWLAEKWAKDDLQPPPRILTWLAGAALAVGAVGTFKIVHYPLWTSAFGLFYFWALWLLLSRPALWDRLPGGIARALDWLGRISYSLYLLHAPLLFLLGFIWTREFGAKPANYLVAVAGCGLILPVAWLFYRAVELPSHRWAKSGASSRRPAVAPSRAG